MALVQAGKNLKNEEVEDIVAFLKTLTGKYKNISLGQLQDSDVK